MMDDSIETECDEEIARYSLENQKLNGGKEHHPRPMSWDGQLTDTEVENDVSVQVVVKEEIEDVEFSSPSPKSTSAFSNTSSTSSSSHHPPHFHHKHQQQQQHHHHQQQQSSPSTTSSSSNPNVQGQMKPSHSFYITHSSPLPQQNNNKNNGITSNKSEFEGGCSSTTTSSSNNSNHSSIKLSSTGPLGQAANSVLNVNVIQSSQQQQQQQQQRVPVMQIPMQQQQNAPQLPSSLPPTATNNNNNNSTNNSISGIISSNIVNNSSSSSSSCVVSSNNTTSVSNNGGLSQLQQQPPMNLSFPRIPPPSPDSAVGWSTPSSNLSRHNSDASQRSFSSSSNNDIQTPPSPSDSPLLSHNRIVNKCDDYDGDQQEVLLSTNFSSQGISRQQLINSPCPICGDRISGFHYGIFSCESCKGFFKRTVQNRKNYVCLRGAQCHVAIATRKKCPACRFDKCLRVGMKLEAIREDRTRGGRSTYACSYALPQTSTTPAESQPQHQAPTWEIPHLLKEIVECESLWHLSAEGDESEMKEPTKSTGNADYLTELCQAADRRLYRLVKWCKALPLFKNIQVDDQTKLLLNSWCELLLFSCCYRSIPMPPGHIRINSRLTLKEGDAPGNQCITRMIHFTDNLRRLKLDTVEYAALKVIILMSSDGLEALEEAEKVRESQERLLQCLQASIQSRCPESPSKFGELLLKIPELQRICQVGKEMLTAKPDESTSFNLLFELLRGDH